MSLPSIRIGAQTMMDMDCGETEASPHRKAPQAVEQDHRVDAAGKRDRQGIMPPDVPLQARRNRPNYGIS